MRIAVPAEGEGGLQSTVSHHFGRCPFFVITEVEDGQITAHERIENPFYAAHQPGQVPAFIHAQGIDLMLVGGMGQRAVAFFSSFGIEVCSGAAGTVENAVQAWLDGQLQGFEPCAESVRHAGQHGHGHHEHHHDHDHVRRHGQGHPDRAGDTPADDDRSEGEA